MSRYFVDADAVPIPEWDDDPTIISDRLPNVIYIRSKMSVGVKAKITSEMFSWNATSKELESRFGENETALLIHNIVRWTGPDFDGVPCTRDNIIRLDPTEPHIVAVSEAIAERNAPPKSPAASATPSISTNAGPTDSITPAPDRLTLQLATGGSQSPLQSAITGHRDRSGS